MIRHLTWIFLVLIAFLALVGDFSFPQEVLYLCVLVTLISLFSELKEFNFWGLAGKKSESNNIQNIEDGKALNEDMEIIVSKDVLTDPQSNKLPTLDGDKVNFLAISFEIERLLRVFATTSLSKDIPSNINPSDLTRELQDAQLITEAGLRQIEAVRWVRGLLVQGRESELANATMIDAISIAQSLYEELFNILFNTSQ